MTKYDFPETGCYQDGACHSQDEMDRFVIELAQAYGWPGDDDWVDDDEADLFINEITDEAIDFLNSLETREGHYWAFENGDFGLWTSDEQESE